MLAESGQTKADTADLSLKVNSDTAQVPQPSLQITNMVSMTQASYDSIPLPDSATLYIIVG